MHQSRQNALPSFLTKPLAWVPSSYFAEGVPFALVIWVAGTLFKDLGYRDGEITIATASVGLAWSCKPLWAPLLDMWKSKKFFVLFTQFGMAALVGLGAFMMQVPGLEYFQVLVPILWVLAFCSATHDICVDGVYITTLDSEQQAAHIGVQGMAWQGGRIFATAALVWIAGFLQEDQGMATNVAWSYSLMLGAATLFALGIYHRFVLPEGTPATRPESVKAAAQGFVTAAVDFLRKPQIWGMLIFVFLFRSGEGFLLVEAPLFLQSPVEEGGLGLSLKDKGMIDGTISTMLSMLGGLVGGLFIARYGLRRTLFFMALCTNVPNLCYVVMSQLVTESGAPSFLFVAVLVSIEKFGYSFGFTANMLYMMQQMAPGRFPMTHYAFCTALMNLVLVPTQMVSGLLAEWMGYRGFFMFVIVASVPSIIAAWFAPFPLKDETGPAAKSA